LTDHYAVIGNPIEHSKSPFIHSSFAHALHQSIAYNKLLAPLDGFVEVVQAFRCGGGLGMNVTAPFKLLAYEMATDKLERAKLAGAANALKFDGDRIFADNFDGIGLVHDIQQNLGYKLKDKRILILGAGGATQGLLLPCLQEDPAEVMIANRHIDRAVELAMHYDEQWRVVGCGYADIPRHPFDIILNSTSASMRGEALPLNAEIFGPDTLAYELVYGRAMTPFLRQAREAGAGRLVDGVGMLVEQAAEAFQWWRGVRPETRAVIDQLTVPIE
jgi:shikimate dehydrogenase